jgi:flagellar basal body-associated protein FliL
MTFLLLNFLQPQTRLSWVVIVAAAVAFAAGVSLFVYFYKRYKRIEKESEEDWDSARRSIFVSAPAIAAKVEEPGASASVEVDAPSAEEEPVKQSGTRAFASDMDLSSFAPVTTAEPEPEVEAAALEQPSQPEPPPPELQSTKVLATPALTETVVEAEVEREAPFEEDVWAGLDIPEQPQAVENEAARSTPTEPLSGARVDQPSQREPFEPPRIERISHREPFEPPSILPLTGRDASATRELRSAQAPGIRQPDDSNAEKGAARGTVRFGSALDNVPKPLDPSLPERETRALAGEAVATVPAMIPERSIPATARARSFGSILGLPAEASHQPLILGEPARPADEAGIGALTNYGKDLGPKGGRAGKIILLIVVLLMAGAAGMYAFVPSVHSRVGSFIGRLRGTQSQDRDAIKPKAQIMPSSRPEVNKNMVTARGAVDNISDEPLEKLEVEVSLQRGDDAPPEIRRIPVTPDSVAPGERGTFEFEYDGKRGSGFAGYSITRLFANGAEVRFRTPAQK